MNEGWVADWIASGASPPAARERTASERVLAARPEDWHPVCRWGAHLVVGDVIRFEAMHKRHRRVIIAEVMSAVWDDSRLHFGLFVLDGGRDGDLAGQCILRRGREVYGRHGSDGYKPPFRLRWDNEEARAVAERAAHREFEAAGDAYRRADRR